jgi:hypothetical protein
MLLGFMRPLILLKICKTSFSNWVSKEFELGECRFVVMEYVSGGELFDYLVANGKVRLLV